MVGWEVKLGSRVSKQRCELCLHVYSYTGTVDYNRMTATCTMASESEELVSRIIRPEFSGEMMDTHVVDRLTYNNQQLCISQRMHREGCWETVR